MYHANYFRIFERAREGFLAECGSPYSLIVEQGFHLAVVEVKQKYYLPIRYGERVDLYLWCSNLSRAKVTFNYKLLGLREGTEVLLHDAITSQVCVRADGGKFSVCRFSDKLFSGFEKLTVESSLL